MKKFINWTNLTDEPLAYQLGKEVERQNKLEKEEAICDYGIEESQEMCAEIDQDYTTFFEKCSDANYLDGLNDTDKNKCFDNLKQLAEMEGFSSFQRLMFSLGYVSLLKGHPKINEMSIERLVLISAISSAYEMDSYVFNHVVLLDERVLTSLDNKTDDFYTKKDIGTATFNLVDDLMEQYDTDDLEIDELSVAMDAIVGDCLVFINEYQNSRQM